MRARLATRDDLPALARLFDLVFNKNIDPTELAAKYAWGQELMSFVATDDNEVVAHYGGMPRRYWLNGQVVQGIVAVDAMTSPAHRKRGLFAELVSLARDTWRARGARMVLGLPNAAAVARAQSLIAVPGVNLRRVQCHTQPHVLIERASFAAVDHLWRALQKTIAPTGRGISVAELDRADADERFDVLQQKTQTHAAFSTIRDRAWIQTRFLDTPGRYRIFAAARDGRMTAYCVVRRRANIGVLVDHQAEDPHDLAVLLSAIVAAQAADVIRFDALVHVPPPHVLAMARAGFWIPRESLPVHLSKLDPSIDLPKDRWFLTGSDFDLV